LALERRHASWVVDLAKQAGMRILLDQARVSGLLKAEEGNIAAAINWSLATPGDESALRIVGLLGIYWFNAGQPEALGWIEQALDKGRGAAPRLRAGALLAGAMVVQLRPIASWLIPAQPGRSPGFNRSAEWAAEAASIFRATGSRRNLAWARVCEARAKYGFEARAFLDSTRTKPGFESQEARAAIAEALDIFRQLDDPFGIGWCLCWTGTNAMDDGRWDEAEALFTEVVERGRLSGVDHAVGEALMGLGHLAAHDGDRQRSVELMGQAVEQYRRARDSWQLCGALDALAGARSAAGDPEGAADALRESLDLAEECGFEELKAETGQALRRLTRVKGEPVERVGVEHHPFRRP
jgi:tetratricopeptide (TPR) repeat protein